MEHEISLFIIRKIAPLFLLLHYLSIRKSNKQKKIKIGNIVFPTVLFFLIFAFTYQFDYDIYDKIIIFLFFPTYFIYLSVVYFKYRIDTRENYKYIMLLLFFITTQVLYILSM